MIIVFFSWNFSCSCFPSVFPQRFLSLYICYIFWDISSVWSYMPVIQSSTGTYLISILLFLNLKIRFLNSRICFKADHYFVLLLLLCVFFLFCQQFYSTRWFPILKILLVFSSLIIGPLGCIIISLCLIMVLCSFWVVRGPAFPVLLALNIPTGKPTHHFLRQQDYLG